MKVRGKVYMDSTVESGFINYPIHNSSPLSLTGVTGSQH